MNADPLPSVSLGLGTETQADVEFLIGSSRRR